MGFEFRNTDYISNFDCNPRLSVAVIGHSKVSLNRRVSLNTVKSQTVDRSTIQF